jgi:hypothetical protein
MFPRVVILGLNRCTHYCKPIEFVLTHIKCTFPIAGLSSPDVSISLINTSLTILPSILVPMPMSSNIMLDITGSKITNLSPPFLSQKIKLQGLAPTCDCNAVNLVRYLQSVESNVTCAAPGRLQGTSVLDLTLDDLTCDSGSSTTPPPVPSTISTTTTTQDDIIWSVAPVQTTGRTNGRNNGNGNGSSSKGKDKSTKVSDSKSNNKVKGPEVNNMDSLIFGIVGGVVALILLFIIIMICFVRHNSNSSDGLPSGAGLYPPAAPSVVSVGPYGHPASSKCTCSHKGGHPHTHQFMTMNGHNGIYGTVRSNAGKMMQYPTLHAGSFNGGSGIYAIHPAALANGGGGGGPGSMTMMPHHHGPQSSPYINANGTGYASMGPSSLGHRQQQQQQQMFNSMPYYIQESEYESRR